MANASRVLRSDFSGGLVEGKALDEFSERQNAIVKGFVLETETQLRSQWACQKLTPADGVGVFDFFVLRTDTGHAFMITINAYGEVHSCRLPEADVSNDEMDVVWESHGFVAPQSRFICATTHGKNAEWYRSAVLIQPPAEAALSTMASIAYTSTDELGQDHVHMYTYDHKFPALRLTDNGEIAKDSDGNTLLVNYTMPWGQVGCMWGSYLVLGDVIGPGTDADEVMSNDNAKRYTNGVWISATPIQLTGDARTSQTMFRIDNWDPRYGFFQLGTPETRIVGMVPVDAGLLVYTTSASKGDGLILLRGYPPGLSFGNETRPTFKPEPVHGGLGAPVDATVNTVISPWPEADTVALIDERGTVWTSNGSEIVQLDRFGPRQPLKATENDSLAPFGRFLMLSRDSRLFAMRLIGSQGAWTELITPGEGEWPVKAMKADRGSLWFLTAFGGIYRYTTEVEAERGMVDGSTPELVLGTATLGSDEYTMVQWHRSAVAVSGPGQVESVRTVAGPALAESAPGYTVQVGRTLTTSFPDGTVVNRGEVVVPGGIGRAAEASIVATFTGDVWIDSVRADVLGKVEKRQ